MAWIEGLTSSNRLLVDLAKILTQANTKVGGDNDVEKNWQMIYPRPFDIKNVTGEALTADLGTAELYQSANPNWWKEDKVTVYETVSLQTDPVDSALYTVDYLNGNIMFTTAPTGDITIDYTYKENEDLKTAFDNINPDGKILLRTTTTAVTPNVTTDPFNTDPDLKIGQLSMYMEIEKPKLLINPETGRVATKYKSTHNIENNYYVNVRVFDRYDYVKEAPVEKVIESLTGLVLDEGAHVSEWSKFSWYQDFKEFMVDELDADPGTDDISDGITFEYLETTGLYGEVPIQYWISTNNDRLALVLMGEPAIHHENYLISFLYAGKIDSFDGSVNDTAGNFALTTGSSTIPCYSTPNPDPITTIPKFSASVIEPTRGTGSYTSYTHHVSYKVVAYNEHGISNPTGALSASYIYRQSDYSPTNESTSYQNFKLTFSDIPENADGVRIYRKDLTVNPASAVDKDWYLIAQVDRTVALTTGYGQPAGGYQNFAAPCPVSNYNATEMGVVRDPITGAVQLVKLPQTWGENTATGVNDITMYKTRSGVYYQRHQASFITPEEFMKKDAFNPSRWTQKFHLSPLYIVHGYDGYRGWLKDVVVVDESSIVHLDELIVNKGLHNEEIYKYFRLTAPFSLMQNSANTRYGIAIKKI